MTDQKPPRLAGDERAVLMALLQFQRDSFIRKVTGVGDAEAAESPVGSGTSLLWLTNHLGDAETTWVLRRFAGRSEAETARPPATSVKEAVARYRAVSEEIDTILGAASLDDLCPPFDDGPPVDVRWIVGHLLEETARHAGHADILRELVDGDTGR